MNDDFDFMEYEASIVKDWPEGMQDLLDQRLIKVYYDEDENPHFSPTESGKKAFNEIDIQLN